MALRKNLGTGIERLELRAAPSTLLGTGISLDPGWHGSPLEGGFDSPSVGSKHVESGFVSKLNSGWAGRPDMETPPEAAAKPQAVLDALFAARLAAHRGSQHAGARAVKIDTADVFNFPTGDQVIEGASSTLRRTPDGISWTFKTNELEPGHVHTVWVVVFNNPEACEGGCGLDEVLPPFLRPEVATTLAYGGGHVVGPSGSATFSGHLQEGDTSGFPLDSPFVGIPGQNLGLVDASQAEIHLVIRDHGEKIPGRVDEQIGSFSGGCDVNACANVQFAVHQP